jgi:hypothetical protein
MENKLMKKMLVLLMVAFVCNVMQAQVTIGTLSRPQEGALLDLKEHDPANPSNPNSEKGILFPKVSLTDVKSLQPVINRRATAADSAKVRGMIVYNVNENANGIDLGLSVWNGEEWMSVVGGGANKAALFTVNWANVKVNGTYVKGKTLTPSNTLSVPVTVSKKGTYNIVAVSANGYSFSAGGQFMVGGAYTLTLAGLGTPTQATTSGDELTFLDNNIDITDAVLKITVTVDSISPEYTCNCGTIVNNATLKPSQAATGSLDLDISVPLDAIGAQYSITTNKVNGVQFSGSGTLLGGVQRVSLIANGTPAKSGQQTFTITTNSTATSGTTCSVNLPIQGRTINVHLVSDGGSRDIKSGSHLTTLLNNPTLFGPQSAYCAVDMINITSGTSFPSALTTANYDIVIFSHNEYPDNSSRIASVTNFLAAGGVVILCSDEENRGKLDLLGAGFTTSSANGGGSVYPFTTNNNSPIVNGKYTNLSGKYMGVDGGYNRYINIPANQMSNIEVIATAGAANQAFMLRTLNRSLFICGDGGPFTGKTNLDNDNTQFPMKTNNGLPAEKTMSKGTAHNAHLFVNIMMWAINERLRLQP